MNRFTAIIIAALFLVPSVQSQSRASVVVTTAFPVNLFQSGPREYFMTTKYGAALILPSAKNADMLLSFTYTRQEAVITQSATPFARIAAMSQTNYVPFTEDAAFSEYGLFTGVRVKTNQNTIQLFASGQLGITGATYRVIQEVAFTDHEEPFAGSQYRYEHGTMMNVQIGAIYGAGILWNPISGISITADLHALNRLTNQPLDVYRSIGVQFGL